MGVHARRRVAVRVPEWLQLPLLLFLLLLLMLL